VSDTLYDGGTGTGDQLGSEASFTSTSDGQIVNIETFHLSVVGGGVLDLSNQTEAFVISSSNADSITGGSGNDTIVGEVNDALLDGGIGSDTLNIGAGFTSASNAQIANIENVTLTAAATLNLSNQTEGFLITGSSGIDSITGGGGADAIVGAVNDTLLAGGGGTDTLRIAADFTSTGDGQIATIENILLTAAGTTLVLTNQTEAFTITGSSGNDTITGGGAADIIDGGGGTDSVTGGAGADRFNVTAGTVTITDLGGSEIVVVSSGATAAATLSAAWTATATTSNAGTASVNANGFNVSVALATGANGWTLTNSTSTGITMTGSANADSITGGSGDDTIVGAQADTLLDGSGGTDTLNIGANFTTTGDSQIANIENILLTAAATLVLTGQTEGFTITGSASADSITGGGGNDIIVAVDTDTKVDGGGGTGDIVRYAAAVTAANLLDADLVNVENVEITNVGNASYDFSVQTEALSITGNSGADTITGGTAADTLTGGSGDDILIATDADTLIDGGVGTGDTVRFAAAVSATNLLDADLVNVENVGITNTGNASYNFSAQTEALVIVGNTGNDTITGGSAADTITGGAGTDTLTGGSGNDIFVALTGTIGIDSLTDFDFGTGSTSVDQFNLAGRALSFNSSYDLAFLESAGTAFSLDEDLVILNSSQRANLAAVDTYYETRSTAGNATNADIIVIWEDTSGLVHVSQGKGSAGTNGSDNGNEWAFTDLFTLNSSQHLIGGTGNITANINLGDFIVV
jgi:Ca2+-binding RTX toxin-like protein